MRKGGRKILVKRQKAGRKRIRERAPDPNVFGELDVAKPPRLRVGLINRVAPPRRRRPQRQERVIPVPDVPEEAPPTYEESQADYPPTYEESQLVYPPIPQYSEAELVNLHGEVPPYEGDAPPEWDAPPPYEEGAGRRRKKHRKLQWGRGRIMW